MTLTIFNLHQRLTLHLFASMFRLVSIYRVDDKKYGYEVF